MESGNQNGGRKLSTRPADERMVARVTSCQNVREIHEKG